ncbi:hypothetical protein L596_006921 [Steinernema carpocapsae]|uniref:Uncharacterized protein n=1 Tax=Steinernema carpocapsae TaxID=34508 RepID=A0A4U5P7K2_STECR|nr:hypothetical protein L596_006921 [Steinernema carpocapsae]
MLRALFSLETNNNAVDVTFPRRLPVVSQENSDLHAEAFLGGPALQRGTPPTGLRRMIRATHHVVPLLHTGYNG